MANVTDKPKPIELCLERVGSASDERYVRCTAQVGRELGLALGVDGRILWCEQSGVGCEIWVSADQRLMAYALAGQAPTTLYRGGRVLDLPSQHPVVLRHHDELELAGTRFRVHVHGVTDHVHAPAIVHTLARAAAAATLALAVGGAAGCSQQTPDAAQDAAAVHQDAGDASVDRHLITLKFDVPGIDGTGSDAKEPVDSDDEIEVLESPPIVF
jgi:hypothetical protein